MSRGFILVEVTVAYVLLAFALVALMPVFVLAIRTGTKTEELQTATYLSTELLEEIRLRRWDELTPASPVHISAPSPLGPDAGETDKSRFDDVDDFNGWTEAGALDPMGAALPDFKSYTRTAAVSYVDANMNASVAATDYKMVTVCTSMPQMSPVCLNSLLTNR